MGVGQARSATLLLLPVSRWPPLHVLNCRASVQVGLRQFSLMVVCSLVVICMWSGEQVSTVFTDSSFWTRNHKPVF